MDRRQALKRIAALSGGALSMTTVSAVLGGCRATDKENSDYTLQVMTPHQNELATVISERIIPATDTPGAKAARVNQFIDKLLADWNTEEEKKHFLKGLDSVDETAKNMHNKPFLELSEERQINVLENKEQEARDNPMRGSDLRPFFRMMKEYTLVGYYTSEIGATEELRWNHVAGRYDGCDPYSKVGRAWSS